MTSKTKAELLAQIVRGRTLLRDAPTRRDVVLHIYGIDIDTLEPWQKWGLRIKLCALIRSVRNREYDKTSDKYSLHYYNDFQFYMLLDKETKIWHCVHIIQQINGEYLLDWVKRQEKWALTQERIGREMVENAYLSTEEREQSYDDFVKEGWKSKLAKEYATDKQIHAQVRGLRQAEQLPKRRCEYRPNIKGIRYVFAENAAQVKLVLYKHFIENNPTTYQHGDEIIDNMLAEIVLCDYQKRDYQLPEPETPDYLGMNK